MKNTLNFTRIIDMLWTGLRDQTFCKEFCIWGS